METVHGRPCLSIASDCAQAYVTLVGGAVGPATFVDGGREVSPYSLAPWLPGEHDGLTPLLDGLRGDFLCLPFGSPEGVIPHGAVANGMWQLVDVTDQAITIAIDPPDIGGHVTKTVSVRDGHPAVYQEFVISNLAGEFPVGTHPIIDVSSQPAGVARISTSAVAWSGVWPGWFSAPERDENQLLEPGATFDDLGQVPALDGSPMDLTRFPTAVPHEDLVMLVNDPAAGPIGWSAVSCPDFVWFALKDVRLLPATLIWLSNGGRREVPWGGRHVGRLGIEEACSYFALGVEPSRENALRRSGVSTVHSFSSDQPTVIRVIQAAVVPPPGFGRVADITCNADDSVVITDEAGSSITVAIDWQWALGDS